MISKLETIHNKGMLLIAKILRRLPFVPLKCKKNFNNFRHAKINTAIHKYFLDSTTGFQNQEVSESHDDLQRNIWVFWWQGKEHMPTVVRLCYESLVQNMGERVVLITQENFKKYTDIPDYILEKVTSSQISLTHFSDILRFNLLRNNGGLWVDATVFWSGSIPQEKYEYLYTCGGYRSENLDDFFVTGGKWTGFLIGGSSKNELFYFMDNFFRKYWKENAYLIDYFLIDYALNYAYEKNIGNFKNYVDTTAKKNNPQLFELSKLVNKPYDSKKIEEITKNTTAFKLSYKKKIDLTSDGLLYKLSLDSTE